MEKKIELLAPAGDLEKLKMAILYGADAVYMGGERFSLRAGSKNFSKKDMFEGIKFAHENKKKVYVATNIIAHNEDLYGVDEYFKELQKMNVDGLIISDPGYIKIAKEVIPEMELHLSTQANTTNYMTANFWYEQGIKRIVCARELSINEIRLLKEKINPDLEIEIFGHGAMCMSYSGRCLISSFMSNRDANLGDCSQPCRWNYSLVEQKRPGEYYPIYEDERGTYFFNSKDLCLIRQIDEVIKSGVNSIKIEGRMKTSFYVSTVVRAYRRAIDSYYENKDNFVFDEEWYEEVTKVSNRDFTTGFFYSRNEGERLQNYSSSSYNRNYDFIGIVLDYDEESSLSKVQQRNKFQVGENIEIIGPDSEVIYTKINRIYDNQGVELSESNVPMQEVWVDLSAKTSYPYILRKKIST